LTDSLEKTARATIKTWIDALGLTPTPTVIQVEEPAPNAKRELPTFGVDFGPEEWEISYQTEIGAVDTDRAIVDFGSVAVNATFVWRCGSKADAEAFRSQFRAAFLLYARAQWTVLETPVVTLPATFLGAYEGEVTLYMESTNNLIYPERRDTGVVDYWVLKHALLVTFPLVVLEPTPGTGIMNVLIEVGQPEDPFDMNDYPGEGE
jgi:hypothetical protein